MQHALDSRFTALKKYIDSCCSSGAPEDFQGYLFRFGTVLICGTIERCIEIVVIERLAHRAQPKVLNFIKSHFKKGTNYDCNNIGQLLVRFDADWGKEFERFVKNNPDVEDGISSLYAVRNSVAHGGTGSVGSVRLKELYDASDKLIKGVVAATK